MNTHMLRSTLRLAAAGFVRSFEASLLLFSSSPKRARSVAVIRLDAIGDFILWLDAAKELRRLYPEVKITLLANSVVADLAGKLPFWDEVWPIDVPQLGRYSLYRWKLLRAIRKRGFDVAIQPTYSRVFREGDALVRASGARERIGSTGDCSCIDPRQKNISDLWYTRLLPAAASPMTELERNAEFMRALGVSGFSASIPVLPKLAELPDHLHIEKPYFIVFPGASRSEKRWPPVRFAAMADFVSSSTGLKPVVCGSADETALCELVAGKTRIGALNLAGKTSLAQFVELVRGASLLVGNDTAAVHFAAAVGTPVVCILGGGHFGRFLPYPDGPSGRTKGPEIAVHHMPCFGCGWNCSQAHEPDEPVPCIGRIAVEDVLRAAEAATSLPTRTGMTKVSDCHTQKGPQLSSAVDLR